MRPRYINPFTDFRNALLQGQQTIRSLTHLKTGQLGGAEFERKAILDLYCENDRGEEFIVEVRRIATGE